MSASVVWVTGARGFIGRHMARHLAGEGKTVLGIGHGLWPSAEAAAWGVSGWLNGDVSASNLTALKAMAGQPSAVYHLAGGSSVGAAIAQPREDFIRTVVATAELLEWIRQESHDSAMVAVSSAAVYGAGRSGRIAEDVALAPYSPYGHHKLMMELLCRSYGASFGIRAVVARLFSVYGVQLRKQLLWDICSRLSGNPHVIELGGTGEEVRDWVNVEDAVRVLDHLAKLATVDVPTLNVGTGFGVSVRKVAEMVIDSWAADVGARPTLSFSGKLRAGDPRSLVADTRKLHEVAPRCSSDLEVGIDAYVRWFRDGT